MSEYAALLRGINVGGKKRLKMADLRALFESMGFIGVQTLLQSGNVIFTTPAEEAEDALRLRIEAGIRSQFGFESRILLRDRAQLGALVAAHPFTAAQLAEPAKILVSFLNISPAPADLEGMRTGWDGPEIFYSSGRELLIFFPDGMGRSKLDNGLIERRLKVISTGRNWNTVRKLYDAITPG